MSIQADMKDGDQIIVVQYDTIRKGKYKHFGPGRGYLLYPILEGKYEDKTGPYWNEYIIAYDDEVWERLQDAASTIAEGNRLVQTGIHKAEEIRKAAQEATHDA